MERLYSKRDRTTIGQFAVLIEYMEQNVAFAKQKARGNMYENGVREKWKDLADQLNSCGPPVRDWKTWRKVWNDFKFETRKKIKLSKMQKTSRVSRNGVALPGLPQRCLELSENQRRVRKLLGMDPLGSDNDDEDPIPMSPSLVKRSPSSVESTSNADFTATGIYNEEHEEETFEDSRLMDQIDITSVESKLHTTRHLQLMMEQNAKLYAMEERRLEVEERRLVIEEERLQIEQKRLEIEQARFAFEKERYDKAKGASAD